MFISIVLWISLWRWRSSVGRGVGLVIERLQKIWLGSASLYPWERHLMLFPTLGPSSLAVVVSQPDERHANRTASVLEWYDRHRAILQHLAQTK